MTGEMSQSDVTPDAFPYHFRIARKYHGEVRPFDVYQGPYVHIPTCGRFWLCSDNGSVFYWFSDMLDRASPTFFPEMHGQSTRAFSELVKDLHLKCR